MSIWNLVGAFCLVILAPIVVLALLALYAIVRSILDEVIH